MTQNQIKKKMPQNWTKELQLKENYVKFDNGKNNYYKIAARK